MAVSVETFEKWVLEVPKRVKDRNKIERSVWIVPHPFCAKRYLKDERYLPGDRAPWMVRTTLT